jgi:D-glycero-alpha-D-manno-heptose-7-phosphate kinase
MADSPAGTGLGSSGSFTTALLKALHTHRKNLVHPEQLAEQACHIEIDVLGEPIGKQDQYIAAYGGLTCFEFRGDGTVAVSPLAIPPDAVTELEDRLLLFFTGYSRSAGSILKDQRDRSSLGDEDMLRNLHYVKELCYRSKEALEAGNCVKFGELLREHWEHKKKRSEGMSNERIDELYDLGLRNGAVGGKLVGAGGGGFLMFYADDRDRLRRAMRERGLEEMRFSFDYEGAKVILS